MLRRFFLTEFPFSFVSPLQAYRASMLRAFKKTLEEGAFTFIIGMSFVFRYFYNGWELIILALK